MRARQLCPGETSQPRALKHDHVYIFQVRATERPIYLLLQVFNSPDAYECNCTATGFSGQACDLSSNSSAAPFSPAGAGVRAVLFIDEACQPLYITHFGHLQLARRVYRVLIVTSVLLRVHPRAAARAVPTSPVATATACPCRTRPRPISASASQATDVRLPAHLCSAAHGRRVVVCSCWDPEHQDRTRASSCGAVSGQVCVSSSAGNASSPSASDGCSNACVHGTCVADTDGTSYHCKCSTGFGGQFCSTQAPGPNAAPARTSSMTQSSPERHTGSIKGVTPECSCLVCLLSQQCVGI